MADNMVKLSRGTSSNFTNLTKDTDTLYFLTDTKRIYLGGTEYTRPVDTELKENSQNAIANATVVGGLNSYLSMALDKAAQAAAELYVPLTGAVTKSGVLTLSDQLILTAGLQTSANIVPNSNNSLTLGTSAAKWKNVYATTFNGALSGNATTATTLKNARNFSIKDIAGTATTVSFNGSGDVALTVPALMTGFESITSNTFKISADGPQMKYDDTNQYLYFSFN